jgi:hypothetical protein
MQVGATEYTDNGSSNILNQVFEGRLISSRLWSEMSPDWNPCKFYLWGNLETKSIQILPTQWINLSTSGKQLHLSSLANSN